MTHIFLQTFLDVFIFDIVVTVICMWCAGRRKSGHEKNIVVGTTFACGFMISVVMALIVAMNAAGY